MIELHNISNTKNAFDFNFFIYELPVGIIVDWLQKSDVKEYANRYVTSVMDIMFKLDELLTIETKDTPKNE